MTKHLRRKAALFFRSLLDAGMHRKAALLRVRDELGASRRSVYRYCGEFSVSTK